MRWTWIFIVLLAAGCGERSIATPVMVAPIPKQYTCAEQQQALVELQSLPASSIIRRRFIPDYGQLRNELRALHRMPAPSC